MSTTREQRALAWQSLYDCSPTKEGLAWIEQTDFGIPPPNTALRRIAASYATVERARVEELLSELCVLYTDHHYEWPGLLAVLADLGVKNRLP